MVVATGHPMRHCRGFDAAVKERNIRILANGLARTSLTKEMGVSESNLEDRTSIHDLFRRYCCALDNGEVKVVVDCITVDAVLKSPVIDISGRDEIGAFAGRFAAQRAAGTQFRHMVSNIAVMIAGNRAAASAYLLVLISKDGNHHSLPPDRCACELIKEDSGQWRFSRRTVFHDHDYTLDGIGR
jgi:ketosteroid isomerase-like protein